MAAIGAAGDASPEHGTARLALQRHDAVVHGYGEPHRVGAEPGRRVRLRGMVGIGTDGRPAMINPVYDLLP
jgi:hypothetical protein